MYRLVKEYSAQTNQALIPTFPIDFNNPGNLPVNIKPSMEKHREIIREHIPDEEYNELKMLIKVQNNSFYSAFYSLEDENVFDINGEMTPEARKDFLSKIVDYPEKLI